MQKSGFHVLVVLLLAAAGSLFAQEEIKGTSTTGRRLFHSPAFSTNGLSCAHCHADFDEEKQDDGRIRAAHSLYNSTFRETWWGRDPQAPDAFTHIADAAMVCVEHYMRNPQKFTAQQVINLLAYLQSITRTPVRMALPIAPAADKTGRYLGFEGGNRISGKSLFFAACHLCHPSGNAGIAPVPIPRDRAPAFYAMKIREGDGLGAVLSGVDPNAYDPASGKFMPFFGADRLAKQQIRDIIAYVKSLPPPR